MVLIINFDSANLMANNGNKLDFVLFNKFFSISLISSIDALDRMMELLISKMISECSELVRSIDLGNDWFSQDVPFIDILTFECRH